MMTEDMTHAPNDSLWREHLMTRSGRRWIVGGLGLICSVLVLLGLLRVIGPVWLVLIVLLMAEDGLLMYVTSRVAELPERSIDERQEAVRNRAYRLSYRTVSYVQVSLVVLVLVLASFSDPHGWLHALWINTSLVIALGTSLTQLLVFLPTMILAWTQPDPVAQE